MSTQQFPRYRIDLIVGSLTLARAAEGDYCKWADVAPLLAALHLAADVLDRYSGDNDGPEGPTPNPALAALQEMKTIPFTQASRLCWRSRQPRLKPTTPSLSQRHGDTPVGEASLCLGTTAAWRWLRRFLCTYSGERCRQSRKPQLRRRRVAL